MKNFLFGTWYGALVVWWVPTVALLALAALETRCGWHIPRIVYHVMWGILAAAVIVGIAAWFVSLFKRRWKRAALQFFSCIASLVGFSMALQIIFVTAILDAPSEDHFADNLTIPSEMADKLVVPSAMEPDGFLNIAEDYDDDFARAVFKSLETQGNNEETVTGDLSALADLVHHRRAELLAYLARHPGWWLHVDNGCLCATRRLRSRGVWQHPLHGYYYGNTRKWNRKEKFETYQTATHFQMRVTLGLPCSPFGKRQMADRPAVGTFMANCRKRKSEIVESCERMGDKDFCVEIFEESATRERRITNAALAFLKDEFATLSLPADAVTFGGEEFVLRNGMQPGIYNLTLRINPGEPGETYLKAYETTKGTRLSKEQLIARSNERVGWSDNPRDKFLYENEFKIYEGDWGKPYAARIEVWFRPDSGKPERKLLERLCKIEGWQR